MTEFARYSPSSWTEDGLVVRAGREALPKPRVKDLGVVGAVLSIALSVMGGGVADHGVWGAHAAARPNVEHVSQPPPLSIATEFEQLAAEWQAACGFLSSTTKRTAHPAFRRIVGMGKSAVPLLLERVTEPGDWDIALAEIVGQNPVPLPERGDHDAAARAWRSWALEHGWTSAERQSRGA